VIQAARAPKGDRKTDYRDNSEFLFKAREKESPDRYVAPQRRRNVKEICGYVNRERLIELCKNLANTLSATGEEEAVARYVGEELQRLGMDVRYQEVEPGRPNVIGTLHGSGNGPVLMFNAHLDHGGGKDPPQATEVIGDVIFGRGLFNMKAAFACYIMAVEMLQKAKVSLRGNIIISGVVGEIESAPVEHYDEKLYRGGGIGARYMMDHGVTADACILGEPSGMRIRVGNTGLIFCQVKVASGSDVILKTAHLARAIKDWEPEFQLKYKHPLMLPQIDISAIEGGCPPIQGPNPSCSLYVIIRTLPNTPPIEVKREIERICASTLDDPGTYWEANLYFSTMGCEISMDEPIVRSIADSVKTISGTEAEFATPSGYGISNDGSRYVEYGIPTVTFGPGYGGRRGLVDPYSMEAPRNWSNNPLGTRKGVGIDNLVKCSQVYALAALDICGKTLAEYRDSRKNVPWFLKRASID